MYRRQVKEGDLREVEEDAAGLIEDAVTIFKSALLFNIHFCDL